MTVNPHLWAVPEEQAVLEVPIEEEDAVGAGEEAVVLDEGTRSQSSHQRETAR